MNSAEICLALTYHFQPARNLMLFEMPIESKPIERRSTQSLLFPMGGPNGWDRGCGPPSPRFYSQTCDYLADLLVITPNDYATEIEIKRTRADWKADLQKKKWAAGLPDWISRFIYAVPEKLGVPDWLPPKVGVIHITSDRGYVTCKVVRAPGRFGFVKVPPKVRAYLLNCAYQRYWEQRQGRLRDAVNKLGQKPLQVDQLRDIAARPASPQLRVQ